MTYSIKLSDPRWQKKRLKIFERDNWSCTRCNNYELSLHIHHEEYTGEPWDAPDDKLKTLCEVCHYNEHNKPQIPSLSELEQTRNELLDKIEIYQDSKHKKNVWLQAISIIENEAIKHYGINLRIKKVSA